jgi:hypothetical protein
MRRRSTEASAPALTLGTFKLDLAVLKQVPMALEKSSCRWGLRSEDGVGQWERFGTHPLAEMFTVEDI